MPLPPIPVQRYLVPDVPPAAPEGFARVTQPVVRGLPHTIQLDETAALLLIVPSGLALTWRDADPTAVVSRSDGELTPRPAAPAAPWALRVGGVERAPARLLVRVEGTTVGVVPLVAGLRRRVPEGGAPDRGARIEIIILGWDLRAGSLRGAGDFGSRLDLAWRRADRAVATFSTPPMHPYVLPRLPQSFRLESLLGLQRLPSLRPRRFARLVRRRLQ